MWILTLFPFLTLLLLTVCWLVPMERAWKTWDEGELPYWDCHRWERYPALHTLPQLPAMPVKKLKGAIYDRVHTV